MDGRPNLGSHPPTTVVIRTRIIGALQGKQSGGKHVHESIDLGPLIGDYGAGCTDGERRSRPGPAGRSSSRPPPERMGRSADLSAALGADGTFRGTPGLAGTVDASAWTLVSDLAAGEPPRFAAAAVVVALFDRRRRRRRRCRAHAEDSHVRPAATAIGPWSNIGSNGHGDGVLGRAVDAIAVSGHDLYVGGDFTNAAGLPRADYIAKWNGSTWSALGSNGHGNGALNATVFALAVSGSTLYVGGDFVNVDFDLSTDYVAKWNGSGWSALGSNHAGDGALNNTVKALAVLGNDLYVGGWFFNAAGLAAADYSAKWNGSSWSALGSNNSNGDGALNDHVRAFAVSGGDLFVGGDFHNAAGIAEADFVAFWTGDAWQALGSNGAGIGALNDGVYALAMSGGDLYVGGAFTNAAGILTADYIARWSGQWHALGSNGAGVGPLDNVVFALAMFGGDLYVGGAFRDAAGIPTADLIAMWDGSAWFALGSNGAGDGALTAFVYAFAVSENKLYVGGEFLDAAGLPTADYVAMWAPGGHGKPDGRIRVGAGAFVGNNIYGTSGAGQSRTGSAARGQSISFGISIQNDGSNADMFRVKASGAAATAYTVKYLHGSTDITAAVVAGTYQTPSLAPAATFLITAEAAVKSTAAAGSKVTRLVTLTSVADSARKDAVELIAKRS